MRTLKTILEKYWRRFKIYHQTPEGGLDLVRTCRGHQRAKAIVDRCNAHEKRDWYSLDAG